MMFNTIKSYFFLLVICSCFLWENNLAQSNTIYYLSGAPQSYYLNPATQPECNVFIGIPIASSANMDVYNSKLSVVDVFTHDQSLDSLIHPLYSNAARDDFLSGLNKTNFINVSGAFNLASLGFRIKEMYFTLDITTRLNEYTSLPKDYFSLLLKGNEDGESFDFSSLNFDYTQHLEWALGISRRFSDQLSVGIRPKILFGLSTIKTNNAGTLLNTGLREWELSSDIDINVCLPGVNIPTDEDGIIDPEGEYDFDSTLNSATDYRKLATNNIGFGIDMGVHYRPIEELELSLSLIDFGYINWKNYTHTVHLNGTYKFSGIIQNPGDSVNFLDHLMDTLKSNMELAGSDQSFRTTLNPKLFVGGRYFIFPKFDLGAISRIEFINKNVSANVFLLANFRPSSVLNISASYNFFNKSSAGFGLGMSLRVGPFNLYAVADDPFGTYQFVSSEEKLTTSSRYASVRVGLNLVFGCNQNKKLRKDKPMYVSDEY